MSGTPYDNLNQATQQLNQLQMLHASTRSASASLQRAALAEYYNHIIQSHPVELRRSGFELMSISPEHKSLLKSLRSRAATTRRYARASHSGFRVGAALLCSDGSIVAGVNVECSSYGGTICAERSALVSALSQAKSAFSMIAVCSDSDDFISPCGLCRQLLFDYCPDIVVVMMSSHKTFRMSLLRDLLPQAFSEKDLRKHV